MMEQQLVSVMETLRTLCDNYAPEQPAKELKLSELYDNYLKNSEGSGSPRAFADKVRLSKIIISELGHYKISELSWDRLSRFVNKLPSRKYLKGNRDYLYSQSHINKIYTNLKCVLRSAVQQGLVSKNIMDDIPCPTARKFVEEREEALTDREIVMLFSAFSSKIMWHTMIMLLAYTGMRPGEVHALKFTDFDYQKQTVKVRRALSLDVEVNIDTKITTSSQPYIKLLKNERQGRKDYARRILTVGSNVIQAVAQYEAHIKGNPRLTDMRNKNGTNEFLFTAPSDGQLERPDYYCNEYRKQLKRNGIDPAEYNAYRFRHTYCTRLFKEQKLDPKTVQRLMGDNDMSMVMRVYNSVNKDDLVRESAAFSKNMDVVLGFVS